MEIKLKEVLLFLFMVFITIMVLTPAKQYDDTDIQEIIRNHDSTMMSQMEAISLKKDSVTVIYKEKIHYIKQQTDVINKEINNIGNMSYMAIADSITAYYSEI